LKFKPETVKNNLQLKQKNKPLSYIHTWIVGLLNTQALIKYEGWNFNNGNYLFTTDTK